MTILYHPDPRRIGERVALPELSSGREIQVSRIAPSFSAPNLPDRRPLADPYLSRNPVRLIPEPGGGIRILCTGTTITVNANHEPIVEELRVSDQEVDQGVVLLLASRIVLFLHRLHASPPRVPRFGMVGESPAITEVRQEIQQVAGLKGAVLVRGETGTGKELVARAIHRASPRSPKPYLAVNIGALPSALASAELFGAVKGAFTGADRTRRGFFQSCQGGTLFLDEIGEAPPEVQVALLRVLENGEVRPVGSEESMKVDVRVIAATDANLEEMIAKDRFRAPLWHRLSGCEIFLPPLRERRDDVGRLLIHFLTQELEAVGMQHRLHVSDPEALPWLSAPLVARLVSCHWLGNVRQLRNVARQLVASCRNDEEARITPAIERLLREEQPGKSTKITPRRKKFRRPEEVGEEELLAALRTHRWRLQPTAAQLDISRTALYGLIDRFRSVRKPGDLSREEIEGCWRRCDGDLEAMVDELHVSRKGLRRRMTELGLP